MKKHVFQSLICVLLCLLFLFPYMVIPTSAAEPALPDTKEALAVSFYHVNSNSTVISKNGDTLLPAASTVKLMSGLLFCEQLAHRRTERVYITKEMVSGVVGHSLGLSEGNELTIEELLYAAICGSYNDAVQVLAHITAQSTEQFVERMNARAKELGAEKTVFTDPIGTADSSLTTANELLKIALAAYQNELYMQICGTGNYYMTSLSKSIKNRNQMIEGSNSNAGYTHYNEKCNGMSAGSTSRGGDCIVASATNGKESYICILLNCGESNVNDQKNNYSYIVANRLINWAYDTYVYLDVISPETVICTIPVTVSDVITEVEVRTDRTVSCYLPSTAKIGEDITYSIRLTHTTLEAPVASGTFVGYVAILYQGEIIETVPLYTTQDAERSSFVSSLKAIQALTKNRRFVAGAVFFVVVLVAWLLGEYLYARYRRRRWNKYFSNKLNMRRRG